MSTITLQEAQANLADLVRRLAPGQAVTITENDRRSPSRFPARRPATPSPATTASDRGAEGRTVRRAIRRPR